MLTFFNLFQKRFEEHKATFDPTVTRDFIDSYLVEQKKEKEFSDTEHYSGREFLQFQKIVEFRFLV